MVLLERPDSGTRPALKQPQPLPQVQPQRLKAKKQRNNLCFFFDLIFRLDTHSKITECLV